MSHSAGNSSGSVDPVQVSQDAVTLDREIEVREEGVVITYRLQAEEGEPVTATVSDTIPDSLEMADAGFHPDNEPHEWSVDGNDIRFDTVVPDQGERIVVFGIATADQTGSDLPYPDPDLLDVEPVNPAVAKDDLDITLPDLEEPDRADAISEVIQGGAEAAADGDGGERSGASSDEIEAALEDLPDSGESEADAGNDAETVDIDEDAAEDTPADPSERTKPADGESAISEGALVETLVAELESDQVSSADREALARALSEPTEGPDPESLDVRLSHVQSRMDDFAAYADALEEIIEEHGTAEGFMAEIREAVDMIDERIEDLHERVDEVESRIEDLAEEAAENDRLEDLDDAVDELRADVEAVNQVRDTLLDAFGEGEAPE